MAKDLALSRWLSSCFFDLMAHHERVPGLRRAIFEIDAFQSLTDQERSAHQDRELRRLIRHAHDTVPYYREVLQARNLGPEDIRGVRDLPALPTLTKEIIRDRGADLLSTAYRPDQIHRSNTGGTTGVLMDFYRDNRSLIRKEGALLCFEMWAGWSIGRPLGIVWNVGMDMGGSSTWKTKVKNRLYRRSFLLDAFQLDASIAKGLVESLHQKRPSMLRGFTNPLYGLASLAEEAGLEMPPLHGVVSTGEMLYPHQRTLMERVYACPVYDSYRSRELGPVAQECSYHDGLHLNEHGVITESEAHPETPEVDELICTDLYNYGMPFIRYRTGDVGTIRTGPCQCGRGTARVHELGGRLADVFVTRDGRTIQPGSLLVVLILTIPDEIGQLQVIQESHTRFVIHVTRKPPLSGATRAHHLAKLRELFGDDTVVEHREVDEIPREPSGKIIFAKNLMKRAPSPPG